MNRELLFTIFFYFFSAIVLGAACLSVFLRSIIKSALALFFVFFGMAGLFVLLGSDFLAVTQIVVYAGGILVMILVGILLTHRSMTALHVQNRKTYILASIAAAAFFVVLMYMFYGAGGAEWVTSPPPAIQPTTRAIGELLLTRYLLPFEFASLTILVCLLGASYLVRGRKAQ